MIETSTIYKTLLKNPASVKGFKAVIAGEDYLSDRLVSIRTTGGLFSGSTMSIGGAVAGTLDMVIRNPGNIPKMAEIKLFYRLTLGAERSEWIPKGVYYIDTRRPDKESNTLTIRGFDAMLMGEQIWEPDQALGFSMPHRAAGSECARLMGVSVENLDGISDAYTLDYPANDYTLRQILRFVAAANGGNFVISATGKLRFVPLNNLPSESNYLVTEDGEPIPFGGVRILV